MRLPTCGSPAQSMKLSTRCFWADLKASVLWTVVSVPQHPLVLLCDFTWITTLWTRWCCSRLEGVWVSEWVGQMDKRAFFVVLSFLCFYFRTLKLFYCFVIPILMSYQDPTSYAYQFQDDPYLSPQNSAEFVCPTKYILLIVCMYSF